MSRSALWLGLILAVAAGACGRDSAERPAAASDDPALPPDQRDAEALGREVFELVDRAIDYRGSHRGRPARSLRQMGVDSLTPLTARHLISVEREPIVTVQFRKGSGRVIMSCRGDSQILEEAAINGGRFTLMCTTSSGAQRPVQVGGPR
ncbi:MAG TPA: hypothetical protein VFT84_01330 [Gemmatimonadales bacterium]|nr:hypothetical protein [Gemmatimonadales bacterium]